MMGLDRARWLIIHGVTAEAWAKRHEITPYTGPCARCGATLTTSIPFASDQLRGLAAPPCACGNATGPYCVVRDSKYGDLLDGGAR